MSHHRDAAAIFSNFPGFRWLFPPARPKGGPTRKSEGGGYSPRLRLISDERVCAGLCQRGLRGRGYARSIDCTAVATYGRALAVRWPRRGEDRERANDAHHERWHRRLRIHEGER